MAQGPGKPGPPLNDQGIEMLKISFRRREGFELANTARRNQDRTHWYRLAGMRRWALVLMVADKNFVSEASSDDVPDETPGRTR
jgi:hypothetical protein